VKEKLINICKRVGTRLRHNLLLKIMAVFFAVILWSYVMGVTDPARTHVYRGLSITVSGVETMEQSGLACANLADILQLKADVSLSVQQSKLRTVSADRISVRIDFSGVSAEGEQTLRVSAYTSTGEVVSVRPSEVTVQIEPLVKKTVQISCDQVGTVPEGYWQGECTLGQNTVDISGAKSVVEQVEKARVELNLAGATETYSGTREIVLFDEIGAKVDPAALTLSTHSVTVDVPIYPAQRIDISEMVNLVGRDAVAPGYEVKDIECSPESVLCAGPQDVLDALDSVTLESLSVEGASSDVAQKVKLRLPSGLKYVDYEEVEVVVRIGEAEKSKTLELPVYQMKDGEQVGTAESTVKATITGMSSAIDRLTEAGVHLEVDVTDLSPGEYTLAVASRLDDETLRVEAILPDKVRVIVQ
jgi:YbbR domain-containing protein